MQQRIYAYPDGTIGTIWMMAFETSCWIDRGTGYNYFDGNEWGTIRQKELNPCGQDGHAMHRLA